MNATTTVLDQLNNYDGDNIWEDVIYRLAYDEAATLRAYEERDRNPHSSDIAVIDGVTYRYAEQRGEWLVS